MIAPWNALTAWLDRQDWLLPLTARLVFAGTLAGYFWSSALTKVGDGLFSPSVGAYAQIFPKAMEAVDFDPSRLGVLARLVVLAGTWAEFLLPLLIVLGLFTRLAALGMAGFIAVQTLTDVFGHDASFGRWFDRAADGLADLRAFWVFLALVLVLRGGGSLSFDRILGKLWPTLAANRVAS